MNKIVVTASDANLQGTATLSGTLDDASQNPATPYVSIASGKNAVMLDCGERVISTTESFYVFIPPVSSATNNFTIDVVAQNGENTAGDSKYFGRKK